MNAIASLDLIGFCACLAGLWFTAQAQRLTSDGRLTLFTLFLLLGSVHLLDALEWSGIEEADRFGDIFKVFTPAVWLFFLFVVRRDGLLQQVDEQNQQLEFFFAQAPLAIAVFDESDRYVAVSRRWVELHDTEASLVGQKVGSVNLPYSIVWKRALERARRQGGARSGLEELKDGETTRFLDWKLQRVSGKHGSTGSILLVEDVTERMSLHRERELAHQHFARQQGLETVGQIATGLAHDVNNLLQVIAAHTYALDAGSLSRDEFRDSLDSIRDAVVSASGMTRWLLQYGRRNDAHFSELDLAELAQRITQILRKALPHNQQLELTLADEELLIVGNRTLLEQLLINLVINARDAMQDGGKITVHIARIQGRVQLEVADQGSGIDESIRSRILEPFFTTKGNEGTGMGLAVVHRVVSAHGGELHLKSSTGHGSRFSVTFPAPESFDAQAAVEELTVPSRVVALS